MGEIKNVLHKRKETKKKRLNQKKILVVGGYGYQNTGDEAQLNVVIERLEKCFPDYMLRVLTPNPDYTFVTHEHCTVGEAPRIAFFHQGESLLYSVSHSDRRKSLGYRLANNGLKFLFLIKSVWIYLNAILVKYNIPTFLLGAQGAGLLYDIQTSKMVYFEGGGYLTGKTLSRLWDGILLCIIAKLFKVPVVMSGQTIGVWNTSFNKWYAKYGFKDVKLITLRDPQSSILALKEIGISGEHVYAVCDDALFCKKVTNKEEIDKVYAYSDINSDFLEKGYVAFNMHYWGITKSNEKKDLLSQLNKIINHIMGATGMNIILIPMTPSDEITMADYINTYGNASIKMIKYNYDFKIIRSIIGNAFCCVTMKHHPIIFSIGENIPVISLNLSDYYEHKNGGALSILNVSKYSIILNNSNYFDRFSELLVDILKNRDSIIRNIGITLKALRIKMQNFEKKLTAMID